MGGAARVLLDLVEVKPCGAGGGGVLPPAGRLPPVGFRIFVRVCLPIPELRRAVGGRAACARVPATRGSLRVSREPLRFPVLRPSRWR